MASGRPRALYYTMLNFQPANLDRLNAAFEIIERAKPDAATDADLARAELCFAPLGYEVDAAWLARTPKLRVIATNTTGTPHIDMAAAERRHVTVISLADDHAFLSRITPTAEHAIGLVLALIRRTPWAHAAVLGGQWNRRPFGAPKMLSRMSLGIVGLGRLGRMTAAYAQAFGMTVRYYDPGGADAGATIERCERLEDLVAESDVISLHLPAKPTTRRLIDGAILARCKPGAYLVNTARGEVLDEAALLAALQDGRLGGAALDVLDGEFAPSFEPLSHPLVVYAQTHDNLLLTPHIGGSTLDAWEETERRVIERAIAHFEEGPDR